MTGRLSYFVEMCSRKPESRSQLSSDPVGPSPYDPFVVATKREKPQDLELAIALDPDTASEVEGPSGEWKPSAREPLHEGRSDHRLLPSASLLLPKPCCKSTSGRRGASLPCPRWGSEDEAVVSSSLCWSESLREDLMIQHSEVPSQTWEPARERNLNF